MNQSCSKIQYKKIQRGRPPVLLLGGLSQIWPLGFAHIPVVIVTAELKNPALASRYICGHCLLPPDGDKDELISRLLQVGRGLRSAVGSKIPLFCGNDHDLALTYEYHDRLSENFLLFGNDPELGLSLLEKGRFHDLAVGLGLPVPRTYVWGKGENGVFNAENPVIVKPRMKEQWDQADGFQALYHTKAKVFSNGRELMANPELAAIKYKILIQDYIPGNDNEIYSFHGLADTEGILMDWFLGRKIRTFPRHTGESSFIELIKDSDLFRTGSDIARSLGLRGVFKMDFKKDSRTGGFILLEINARYNLWLYLGAVNGVNIPQAAYEYLVYGIRHTPRVYGTRYKWNNFLLDCHAFRELHALGELNFGKWSRSLLTRHVQDIFTWKDPMPFLHWATDYVSKRMHKWHSSAS